MEGKMGKFFKVAYRVIIVTVLIAIAIPIVLGFVKQYVGDNTKPPSIANAPWEIATTSRLYYGEYFSFVGNTPELKNYYILDGTKYTYRKSVISFDPRLYGTFGISVILVQRTATAK